MQLLWAFITSPDLDGPGGIALIMCYELTKL